MPSIRDLVAAIRQREGVDAAIVLGRDGLLIDSQIGPGLDAEDIAARIPAIIGAGRRVRRSGRSRRAAHRGARASRTASRSSPCCRADAILLVLVARSANIGQLLFELRRNREHIAALV